MGLLGSIIKRSSTLAQKIDAGTTSPIQRQTKTLKRLLKKAELTAFGVHYNFTSIIESSNLVKTFQQTVPVFDYDAMHDAWWYRALNEEHNVAWPRKIKYFALSSGTSGAPSKYLPMSREMIRAIRKAGLKIFFSISRYRLDQEFYDKDLLLVSGSTSLKGRGGYYVGDMSGINVGKTPFWLRKSSRPGREITRIPDWNKRLEEIAKNAKNWDVGSISGIPSWIQLMIEKVVEYNGVTHIHEIWPNLRVFVHGGISMEPHRKAFEAIIKKPMIYIDTYLASEGFIAFQNRPGSKGMALILNNGIFHEFIPFNDANFDANGDLKGNPTAFTVENIKEGVEYALIISTCAGAWRYLIGDTVRFTDAQRKEIVITGRTKHFLSVCGEHLSVDNMNQGVRHLQETLGANIREFTVSVVPSGDSFAHRWYLASEDFLDHILAATILDARLQEINDDYATERSAVLQAPQIETLSPQIFYDFMKYKGKIGGQAKFPRVMKNELFEEWEHFVSQHTKRNKQLIN